MKLSEKMGQLFFTIVVPLIVVVLLIRANPWLFHRVYAVIEAPFCIARVANKLNVDSNLPAIIGYFEEKLTPGMTREAVHETFSNAATMADYNYEHHDIVILIICSESRNDLIFLVYYDENNKLTHFEYQPHQ